MFLSESNVVSPFGELSEPGGAFGSVLCAAWFKEGVMLQHTHTHTHTHTHIHTRPHGTASVSHARWGCDGLFYNSHSSVLHSFNRMPRWSVITGRSIHLGLNLINSYAMQTDQNLG